MPRITPRSHALLLAAGVHFGMGGSIIGTVGHLHDPDKAILWEAWPADLRATLWLTIGTLVLVGAFSHRMEVAAFALAVVMPFERAVGHLWSWWQWVIPEDPGGDARGLALALVWLSLAGFIGLGATIVHPPPPPEDA